MFFIVLLVLLLLPVLELWAIIEVSSHIQFFPTLVLLIVLSVFGMVSIKVQGLRAWQSTMQQAAAGTPPTKAMLNGALGVIGSFLFIIPGFITAAIGAVLLFPPTRALLRPILAMWILSRVQRLAANSRVGTIIIGGPGSNWNATANDQHRDEILDVEGWEVGVDGEDQPMLGRGGTLTDSPDNEG